jgi:hypothetical protein
MLELLVDGDALQTNNLLSIFTFCNVPCITYIHSCMYVMQAQLIEVYQTGKDFGLHISRDKTKMMVMGRENTSDIYIYIHMVKSLNVQIIS